MKIYISADMEGISGINAPDYVKRDGRLYSEGRKLLTEDINAAVRGAFDAGAEEVIVADMHGMSNNVLIQDIDERALVLVGSPRNPRFAFLDESVDGMILLGYHAMGGTQSANLEHTMSSASWFRFVVNGEPWGELAIDATIAAESGVPVIMVSGDDKLCEEARRFLGERPETACVKQGLGRNYALCLSPTRGQQVVYQHARAAVKRLAEGEIFEKIPLKANYTVTLTYKFVPDADNASTQFGAKRIDGYTVEWQYDHLSQMFGGIWSSFECRQLMH